jgi:L-ribulose-5-phosphate 3-epimerase
VQVRIGIMQGRLSPPEDGRFQSFPRLSWRLEFSRAREAGITYIEWIYDHYGAAQNPLTTAQGRAEINFLKAEYGVETRAVCGDWLMDFPLIRCSEPDRAHREKVLHDMLGWASEIGASRIVLPFVDNSSIRSAEEQDIITQVLERAIPIAEDTEVEMHIEADFPPSEFARFLNRLPHPTIKVNYDVGNSSGLGYIANEEFSAYGNRIGSIHIKDRLRKPDGSVVTMPLGQGSADFDDVFASIRRCGYAGGLTLQVARGEDGDEVNWIARQIAFLSPYLA